jgi:hypothetical protein
MEGFDEYITSLRSETGFELARLEPCRDEVCVAIWGDGNPDISGMGVRPRRSAASRFLTDSASSTGLNRLRY